MSLAQLRREVNSIKRKLVHQLRVVRARRVTEKYCQIWADLVARKKLPPDPFRLLKNLFKHTRRPGNFIRADGYLEQCRELRHLPYPTKSSTSCCPRKPAWASYPTGPQTL